SYLRFFCLAPSSSYIYTLSLHDALPISDPIFARLAADCGYSAVHLSGNAIHKSFCLPDQNLLTVTEIASRASQIADAADLPLIVDGGPATQDTNAIARAMRSLERAGAAAIRFED